VYSLLVASVLAMVSALLGGLTNIWGLSVHRETIRFSNGFSAGLLISISLVHLLPESSLEINYPYALIGFSLFYLIEGITRSGTCTEQGCDKEHTSGGLVVWSGMSFHALVDGIAMGVGFTASERLGFLIALAILIHKAPIGFSLSGVLSSRGYKKAQVVRLLVLFSMLTPLGAILSGYFISVKISILKAALAFSGGTFLHISISGLLPQVHNQRSRSVVLYVIAGMVAGALPRLIGIE
jgi:zinc transporter ZupT